MTTNRRPTVKNDPLLNKYRRMAAARRQRQRQRAANSYPSNDKPKVNYFTVANFFWAILVLLAFSLVGQLYWFTAGVYVDTFAALSHADEVVKISLGSGWISSIPVIGVLLSIPLVWIETIVNGFETTSLGLVGLAIYMILQTGELLPTVIWESPELMFWLIRKFDSHKKIEHSKHDSNGLKKLKIRHNEYYDNFLHTIEDLRLVCYIIDISICFFLVRFVRTSDGMLQRFLSAAAGLTFGIWDLDPLATTRMMCSLFLLWLVLKMVMRLTRGFKMFARRD